ncbi:transcriptional repressor LexA [Wenzhouxiangella sediminis]|jgi:repressor LexA|uniref:LexA repressor n=1 Tax=Wenzhouxiangella sediminis TaxID=1792836 RepID=A0A3E1KD27_9GAMM|nr:transcriptional repressor LexA [Wenzhouxiangella sediminis]RFF32828.1 transcriptional repressor LexA [Wenzhouxiangella sediminis]
MQLTARQQQILDFIEQRMAADGLPPTRAEIVEHFGFASPNAAQCHLRALAERGAIELRPGRARGIVPLRTSPAPEPDATTTRSLPVIGRVAAGSPLLAIENLEDEIRVDAELFHPAPDYALKVRGDSMVGAGIDDGDLLLVHRTPEARAGQIVVARIDGEVTVKRLRRKGRGIFLDSENPAYASIHVSPGSDFAIEGLAVGSIRAFQPA